MPYWCSDCRSYFSVRTGHGDAMLENPAAEVGYRHLPMPHQSLKSVSSMKLHRDLKVTQKTAWFMLHRIREAWTAPLPGGFAGPVEADETFVGGQSQEHARREAAAAHRTRRR